MKRHLAILIFLLTPFLLTAQTPKYIQSDSTSALIGEWEWVKDPTGSPYSPFPDLDFVYITFSAGKKLSMGAISFDETKGFGCPSYFLLYTNEKTITGTLTDCCIAADKGKKFSFNYEYDLASDQLIVTVNDEMKYYKRRKI